MDYHNMMLNNYEREQEELALIERINEEYPGGYEQYKYDLENDFEEVD